MRLRAIGSTLCVAAVLGLSAGCSKESPRGGTGAAPTDSANTFKVDVPKMATGVTQGETRDVTVSVNRGNKFDQDVKLTFHAPKGIEVKPETATAKKGSDEVKITVHAAADAKTGKEEVEVVGTPATGSPTSVKFAVDVKQKS
jgi:uncharacterized membrane protein